MADYPPIHAPARPDWTCTACAQEWPCPTRKRQLRQLFGDNLLGLLNYMRPYLSDANLELGHLTTIQVTTRFIGWCAR